MPLPWILALNTLHALISFFTMFFLGYISYKRGNRLGIYFAMAYLIYFILVLTEATYVQLGRPGYFAELSHVAWATLLETIILSFLLSKRFEWERRDSDEQKELAQQALINQTLENQRILNEQNVFLEKKVSERTLELEKSLDNLKKAQAKLIQSEKLASLGELTAGIAHEIQNPLNFVNNFSEVSDELLHELQEEIEKGRFKEAQEIAQDLQINLSKIANHGKRADDIVKGMLQHSRGSGHPESTDINALCDDCIRLAYHGLRANDKSFNAKFITEFDESIEHINIVPQDIGRVLLNLINNACFAVNDKKNKLGDPFEPCIWVITKNLQDKIEIIIKDNGDGIPKEVQEKIFQPFFTTKDTGLGTGLGLSISYDIITKGHHGEIRAKNSEEGGALFNIILPKEFQVP